MSITLTRESVAESLQKALAAKGEDYVYESPNGDPDNCLYQTYVQYGDDSNDFMFKGPTGPSCIVGHVLLDHGVSPDALKTCEGTKASAVITSLVDDYPAETGITRALDYAQELQDEGQSWGQAVEAYHEYLQACEGL